MRRLPHIPHISDDFFPNQVHRCFLERKVQILDPVLAAGLGNQAIINEICTTSEKPGYFVRALRSNELCGGNDFFVPLENLKLLPAFDP
jgi:hypothetical protein